MDLVLQPGAFTHQLGTTRRPAPRKTRRLLGQPHLWEKARPEKLGEGAGVELVGLGSGIPDALCDAALATTTRATCGSISRAMASALPVASRPT